jgi:hypothetical protein
LILYAFAKYTNIKRLQKLSKLREN